ncbi:MAG: FHA domain-containing protein [Massilibacteroides sp.]|nr:FHA domain-containing protein [Massilibacteroides sp.]MDD3061356.1 FHA domain-containing protein [Massilibacteroides sp.]MDD4659447.1 FHA domain-containing protein [Massilibacteroides sp.]
MISLKCPYCQVKLKVDETKLPKGLESFKCPKCKKEISVSLLSQKEVNSDLSDTVIINPTNIKTGHITVIADAQTPDQYFLLHEGIMTFGRKSSTSEITCPIVTTDKMMSRNHMTIEVKKDSKGTYKHYLSDNNSKNRTLYNNNYLEAGEIVILHDNDEIVLGRTTLRFNV